MVTLNSCLIWQIIRFILPPKVCVFASLSGPAIGLQKMPFFLQKKKIIFSDEAHFDLGVYVNEQNYRIWGTENPHAYIEKPTHPKVVTIWCGFWSRGIIGPFFFENEQWEAVTVNGDRYRAMLNECLFTKIEEEDMGNIRFQRDDVTCHIAEADVVWPPRSCDLTPLDYYLWGDVKDKCYADKPETIDAGEIQLHTAWPAKASIWRKLFSIINRKDCKLK